MNIFCSILSSGCSLETLMSFYGTGLSMAGGYEQISIHSPCSFLTFIEVQQ